MKSFALLFKRYRLLAEFPTISAFSNALGQKGYYFEESIFYHWQKGSRVPTDRKLIVTVIEIFVEHRAIKTKMEAQEFLASTGLGYLTLQEEEKLKLGVNKNTKSPVSKINWIVPGVVIVLFGGLFYIYSLMQKNYIDTSRPVPSAVTEPKKLVIGTDATLEPMEYIEDGRLAGFDIDLGNDLAKALNADIEFRNITFDNLFNSLDQRQINMIISAVTITDERQKKYEFSDHYLDAGQVIVTKKMDNSIHGVSDLKGKKIATQTGTTNEKEALNYTQDKFVMRYTDFVQATDALEGGKVDVLFTDLPNAKGIISEHTDLKIVGAPFTKEYYGIVFLKNDPSITQINEALLELRKNGSLTKLERKWFKGK
jgi:ABC-type amino acid transport substrate-binding protein